MEQSTTQAQPHTIWINRSEHILSFHEVQCDGYEPLVFSNHKEKWTLCLKPAPMVFASNKIEPIKQQGDPYEVCH